MPPKPRQIRPKVDETSSRPAYGNPPFPSSEDIPFSQQQRAAFQQFVDTHDYPSPSSVRTRQPGGFDGLAPARLPGSDDIPEFVPSPRQARNHPVNIQRFPDLLSSLGIEETRQDEQIKDKEFSEAETTIINDLKGKEKADVADEDEDEDDFSWKTSDFNPWTKSRAKPKYDKKVRNPPLPVGKTVFAGKIIIAVTSSLPPDQFTSVNATEVIGYLCKFLQNKYQSKQNLIVEDWRDFRGTFKPSLDTRRTLVWMYFENFLRHYKPVPGEKSPSSSKNVVFNGRGLPDYFQETGLTHKSAIPNYSSKVKAEIIITHGDPHHQMFYLLAHDIFIRDVQPVQDYWPGYPEYYELEDEDDDDVDEPEPEVEKEVTPPLATTEGQGDPLSPVTPLRRSTRKLGIVVDEASLLENDEEQDAVAGAEPQSPRMARALRRAAKKEGADTSAGEPTEEGHADAGAEMDMPGQEGALRRSARQAGANASAGEPTREFFHQGRFTTTNSISQFIGFPVAFDGTGDQYYYAAYEHQIGDTTSEEEYGLQSRKDSKRTYSSKSGHDIYDDVDGDSVAASEVLPRAESRTRSSRDDEPDTATTIPEHWGLQGLTKRPRHYGPEATEVTPKKRPQPRYRDKYSFEIDNDDDSDADDNRDDEDSAVSDDDNQVGRRTVDPHENDRVRAQEGVIPNNADRAKSRGSRPRKSGGARYDEPASPIEVTAVKRKKIKHHPDPTRVNDDAASIPRTIHNLPMRSPVTLGPAFDEQNIAAARRKRLGGTLCEAENIIQNSPKTPAQQAAKLVSYESAFGSTTQLTSVESKIGHERPDVLTTPPRGRPRIKPGPSPEQIVENLERRWSKGKSSRSTMFNDRDGKASRDELHERGLFVPPTRNGSGSLTRNGRSGSSKRRVMSDGEPVYAEKVIEEDEVQAPDNSAGSVNTNQGKKLSLADYKVRKQEQGRG